MNRPIDPDLDGFPDTRMATPNELRKMLHDAIRRGAEEKTENRALRKAANDPWRTDDPPQDGTVIVAIGNISEEWDGEIDVKPFTDSIYWIGGIGWVCQDGMSLVQFRDGDCRVTIHHWLPDPESPAAAKESEGPEILGHTIRSYHSAETKAPVPPRAQSDAATHYDAVNAVCRKHPDAVCVKRDELKHEVMDSTREDAKVIGVAATSEFAWSDAAGRISSERIPGPPDPPKGKHPREWG